VGWHGQAAGNGNPWGDEAAIAGAAKSSMAFLAKLEKMT
jgi:hypothetical protein